MAYHSNGVSELRASLMPPRTPNRVSTPALAERIYYHGTPDAFAPRVLETWTLMPRSESGVLAHKPQTWLDPLVGRVYLAQQPYRALRYLGVPRVSGHDVGLLLEVDGRNLREVHPDEDDVGIAAYVAGSGVWFEGGRLEDALWVRPDESGFPERTPLAQHLVELSRQYLTRAQIEQVMGERGPPTIQILAKIGKKLVPHLSDADQLALIELGAAVAHVGPLPVDRAFACPIRYSSQSEAPDFVRRECTEIFDVGDYYQAKKEMGAS